MNATPHDSQDRVYSDLSDDESFAELLEMFVAEVGVHAAEIEQYVQAGEIERLQFKAHQLKGAAGGYGFGGLTALAARLEEACQTSDTEHARAVAREVLAYIRRIAV